MAGYFNKLMGYMYDGTNVSGEELTNGVFVTVVAGKANLVTAKNTSLKLRVLEKTTFAGLPAVEVLVVDEGSTEIYMVENLFTDNQDAPYDNSANVIKAGEYVRMRRPETVDHMIISVDSTLYGKVNVDDTVVVDANGVLASAT